MWLKVQCSPIDRRHKNSLVGRDDFATVRALYFRTAMQNRSWWLRNVDSKLPLVVSIRRKLGGHMQELTAHIRDLDRAVALQPRTDLLSNALSCRTQSCSSGSAWRQCTRQANRWCTAGKLGQCVGPALNVHTRSQHIFSVACMCWRSTL